MSPTEQYPAALSRPPSTAKAGLTLIEIIISVMVLTLILCGFLSGFLTARRTAAMAQNEAAGIHRARQQMEELLSFKFWEPQLSTGIHLLSNGTYTVTLDPSNPSFKQISLDIWWVEPRAAITSTINLTTWISTTLHK